MAYLKPKLVAEIGIINK